MTDDHRSEALIDDSRGKGLAGLTGSKKASLYLIYYGID